MSSDVPKGGKGQKGETETGTGLLVGSNLGAGLDARPGGGKGGVGLQKGPEQKICPRFVEAGNKELAVAVAVGNTTREDDV